MKINKLVLFIFAIAGLLPLFAYAATEREELKYLEEKLIMHKDASGELTYSESCFGDKKEKCQALDAVAKIDFVPGIGLGGVARSSQACMAAGGMTVSAYDAKNNEVALCNFKDQSFVDLGQFEKRINIVEKELKKQKN